MKIRTQFILTLVLFSGMLFFVAALMVITNQRLERLTIQEKLAINIERGASDLGYLSNEYLLYRESQQRTRWESKFASVAQDISNLDPEGLEQQAAVNRIKTNQQRLKAVFTDVVSTLDDVSLAQGAEADPAPVRVPWSRMAVQNQGTFFEALRLSNMLGSQADKLQQTERVLILILIGLFVAFLLSNYALFYRRTLKSIRVLQSGAGIVGSGNLDYSIQETRNDEIGELTRAFNRMTASLKKVTASKTELQEEIAERKLAEEALKRKEADLREAQRISHIGSWYWDAKTDATTGTEELLLIFGLDPAKPLAPFRELRGLLHTEEDWVRLNTAIQKAVETGVGYELDLQATRKGAPIWITTRSEIVRNSEGLVVGLRGTVQDITERKRLEEEVNKRAEELAVANKELESFSYSISHDLRAPLRSIKGFSDILLEDYADKLDAEAQNYLKRIAGGTDKMSELIDDMLSLAKVSRQEMSLQRIDLTAIAHSVVNELRQAAPNRTVGMAIMEALTADGDQRLLNIALSNLIGNAWKYTSKTPDPSIEVGSAHRSDHRVYYVRDNGAGFDMKLAGKLFAPFQRLHTENQFPGTGIGLAIVNRVIQRHGGRIWAESEVGKGATFYFTLA